MDYDLGREEQEDFKLNQIISSLTLVLFTSAQSWAAEVTHPTQYFPLRLPVMNWERAMLKGDKWNHYLPEIVGALKMEAPPEDTLLLLNIKIGT